MSCEFVDEKQIGWTKWLRLKTREPPKMDEFLTIYMSSISYNYNTKNKDYMMYIYIYVYTANVLK